MMKNRQKPYRKREQIGTRTRKNLSGAAKAAEPVALEQEEARSIHAFQQILGNRAVARLVQNSRSAGRQPSQAITSAVLRKAIYRPASAKAGVTPGIQREEAEALDAAPAVVNDGLVTINEPQSETYEVRGATLAAVSAALDPVEWGRCSWTVDYSFETAGGRATKVDITLHLTIRMPRWAGEGFQQASEAAREEWQRMLGALQAHEDHHAEIARNWAPTFKERMLNKRQSRLASTYQQVLGEMEKEQKKYDKDSHHGQTEGVSQDTSIQ